MATTTPSFSWPVPTSSDLVKNGATAIEALGDAIDASMTDLKGGTTGQVLAKATGTDMDFTWTTPSGGSSYVAGKNAWYNSAFDIWQRGTSSTGTAYNYTADRWLNYRGAFAAGATFSRVASTQTGFQYALKAQRDLANTGTDVLHLRQGLETTDSLRFAGQTVTVSFYAKAGANFSPTSSILVSTIYQGEGTDQAVNNMTGWTGVTAIAQNNTLTTSWQRFTQTTTISSAKTQIGIAFTYTPTGVAGADDSYQITGVQIETASTASGFSRQTGSIQGELAACQRYGWSTNVLSTNNILYANGSLGTTTRADFLWANPVPLRAAATSITATSSQVYNQAGASGPFSGGTWAIAQAGNAATYITYTHGSSMGSTGQVVWATSSAATGFIFISAEL
jgi:hypothetical protein